MAQSGQSGQGGRPDPSAQDGAGAPRPTRPPVRVLDPASALRDTEGRAPDPALYLADRLLVSRPAGKDRDLGGLERALSDLGLRYAEAPRRGGGRRGLDDAASRWGTSIQVLPANPIDSVDAWTVLQRLRHDHAEAAEGLSLEHVLRPADGYWGGIGGYWGGIGGYWGGIGGYWGGIGVEGLQEYSVPGRGGRMPVSVAMPDPALRARDVARAPVVALLDTAVALHPWFTDDRTVRLAYADGTLSVEGSAPGAQQGGAALPVQPLGVLHGHGTFIAGLVRQGCPEATILSVPVMGDDGMVDEADLLDVMEALLDRHETGQRDDEPELCIDVLSVSLGYYAEDDTYRTGPVKDMLQRFATAGVAVVAGAGNDGVSAPFVPAALAGEAPARLTARAVPPVASVGAANPDGSTVALFSNPLSFITAVRAGVSVVSTLPLTNGMGQPSSRVDAPGSIRCTVDPDDYTGGFGVWSGTSFSTPVFAAELADAIAREKDVASTAPDVMRKRAIRALRACTGKDGS